jgi:alkylation response protein AidB-like acyl-CoA dehydrogenase
MDLSLPPEVEQFRATVRAFLAAHRDDAPAAGIGEASDRPRMLAWQRLLVENGYAGRTIPRAYGGHGATEDLLELFVIEQEFAAAGVSLGMQNQGIGMLVPTLLRYGSEAQKSELIGPTLRGDLVWCQGYSEPEAGSDLANLRTRALRDGADYVVSGQKIWTSTAHQAHRMFALVRTEQDAGKHGGISYLLIDMASPGITVRPLVTMTGDASFNEVFFDRVRVPATNLVGEPGQGWEIGTHTLRYERHLLGRPHQTAALLASCTEVLRDSKLLDQPVFRERLMRLDARALAMRCHGLRLLTEQREGRDPGLGALIVKLNGCQLNFDICQLAIDALGERGLLYRGASRAAADGAWQAHAMYDLGLIIGGGTAQIQKNIIAEAGLGLPREPKAAG